MSSSQHPVALRLESHVGGSGRLLATVMGLPLVDGIFPAVVLAGGLSTAAGVLQVGLLIFGGSATLAVILAEMDQPPRAAARTVALVGAGVVALAAVEAALAPTIQSALDLAVFKRFAALVIAAVAAKTASARVGEWLPRPAVIVGLGLVASARPASARVAVAMDPALVARGAAAAGVGVAFALAVALAGPRLRSVVDVDRFRFGSAVALGLLPLSILGMPFGHAPLAVVAVTGLLAVDPDRADRTPAATDGGRPDTGSSGDPVRGPPVRTRTAPARAASDPDRASGADPDPDPDPDPEPWVDDDPAGPVTPVDRATGAAPGVPAGDEPADERAPCDPSPDDGSPTDDSSTNDPEGGSAIPPATTTTATEERAPWL